MSNEERSMILEMVAEGKISTGEAAELLDALDTSDEDSENRYAEEVQPETGYRDAWRQSRDERRRDRDARRANKLSERGLLINVQDGGETRTNVHIPLAMAAAATKFVPKKAREYFEQYGIDLNEIIDSVSSDLARRGEIVNVVDGETRVQVTIT